MIATAEETKPYTGEQRLPVSSEQRGPAGPGYFRKLVEEQGLDANFDYFKDAAMASRIRQAAHPGVELSDSVVDAPQDPKRPVFTGDYHLDRVLHGFIRAIAEGKTVGEVLTSGRSTHGNRYATALKK